MGWTVLQVAVGGALGAVSRHLTGLAVARIIGTGFPAGTMIVNVSGSFLVGMLFVVFGGLNGEAGRYTPLLMTGFLGGYTTFSAYSLDSWLLFQQGRLMEAVLYAFGSAGLSVAACIAGIALARFGQG